MYFIFPPHLTCASALPGETRNPKSASFHLNAACLLPKNTQNTLKYHLVTAEPPSLSKRSTGCTRQDLGSCCLLPTSFMLTKSVTVLVAVQKMGVVLRQAFTVQLLQRSRLIQHLSEKCDFRVSPFCQVVQKHRLFEVAN